MSEFEVAEYARDLALGLAGMAGRVELHRLKETLELAAHEAHAIVLRHGRSYRLAADARARPSMQVET